MLELLFSDTPGFSARVVVVRLVDEPTEELASVLREAGPPGRLKVLPEPESAASATAFRHWYHDLWWALTEAERASLILASGRATACLAPLLPGDVRVVAGVHDPLETIMEICAKGTPIPTPSSLHALKSDPDGIPKPRIRAVANPQSRALLLPWSQADELPITLGPAPDADRWRHLLFNEAVPLLRPVATKDLPVLVHTLAQDLGYGSAPLRPLSAVQQARTSLRTVKTGHAALLADLNWLDRELYEFLQTARRKT